VAQEPRPNEPNRDAFEIDRTVAHPARVHNYLAGGDDNFSADRKLAAYLSEVLPDGIDTARTNVMAMGAFMARSIRYLVHDADVQQFLYIGAPIPSAEEVHEVAQKANSGSRVVYVGNDPLVLAHAHKRREAGPLGATAYVHGTLRDVDGILQQAAATLDFDQSIAIMFIATLALVPDRYDPQGIVARLLAAVPPGSHLVIAHTTNDIPIAGMAESAERFEQMLSVPYVVRNHAEVSRFFDGLDLVEPGVVPVDRWHPDDPAAVDEDAFPIPIYGAVGRKP
jgi:S-adenosyl methyltransferase